MKINYFLSQIKSLKKEYQELKKDTKKDKLLNSKINHYTKEDKEKFKNLRIRYIDFFSKLKNLIQLSNYRKYFFFVNYNNLILRKYVLIFYFNSIIELWEEFWKHGSFIRIFLWENFKKNYWFFARYIYKPKFINLINTPNIFMKPFKKFINKELHCLIWSKSINIKNINRLKTDYNTLFFYLKNKSDKTLFSVVKKFWYLISSIKFSPRKKGLIKKENLEKYIKIAKPWDILLTRWNWNASNLNIPWFWKHTSMYIWTWDFLKNNFPWDFSKGLNNNSHYIIESIKEWVVIKTLEETILEKDYLWVIRTTFKEEKINRSLQNSLNNIWKWYDYIFNFHSNENLICSELILKSYEKEYKWDEWIEVRLENIWISLTFPPNNFLDIISEEREDITMNPIFFIDSVEKTWENFISNIYEFIDSRKRSKLSFFVR